jgi:tRNA-splicing ligase RtcB
LKGSDLAFKLAQRGITVKADSLNALAEEASEAYKDVAEVIEVADKAGICHKVVRTVPLGVIKG